MTLEGLNDDFRDLLVELADAGVEFVIVGAFALAFHGAPRASGDIDIFVRPTHENAERIVAALVRFGAPLTSAGIDQEDFARPGMVYQIGLPPRRIDLLTEISGVSFEEAWASREAAEIEALVRAAIPTVIVTSGGYTRRSHELVAELAPSAVDQLRAPTPGIADRPSRMP